ncbi:hypothetical protein PMIN01_07006 [Paraphaeosphaeria minitans]|uniref:Uncharacterized protein n=1 Tax=Paraphaeosphaeria minitans TaxID=565426 RepID=A0A9P6GI45_9PLEO|nr:hypothetical protein PMIN01_07006 [Paraphaeosphaeria minitans]
MVTAVRGDVDIAQAPSASQHSVCNPRKRALTTAAALEPACRSDWRLRVNTAVSKLNSHRRGGCLVRRIQTEDNVELARLNARSPTGSWIFAARLQPPSGVDASSPLLSSPLLRSPRLSPTPLDSSSTRLGKRPPPPPWQRKGTWVGGGCGAALFKLSLPCAWLARHEDSNRARIAICRAAFINRECRSRCVDECRAGSALGMGAIP